MNMLQVGRKERVKMESESGVVATTSGGEDGQHGAISRRDDAMEGENHHGGDGHEMDSNLEFSKDTFITSLRTDNGPNGVKKSNSRQALVQQVNGMARVQELHGKLCGVVGSLSDRVADVLKKQETEFLSAYRAHMYNVQKELQDLQAKVKNAELALQRDEKIKQLTQERDWFRKEALRLDSYSTSMKKEMKFLEEKLESVEEDRAWLEKQVKSSKKQNKLLRTELELHLENIKNPPPEALENGASQTLFLTDVEDKKKMNASMSQGNLPSLASPEYHQNHPNSSLRSKSSFGHYNTPMYEDMAEDRNNHQHDNDELTTLKRSVRQLREMLHKEKETVKGLRASIVNQRQDKTDLEDFFLRSIQDVKKDIAKRKAKAKFPRSKTISLKKNQQHDDYDALERELKAIRLQDFSTLDRKKVVERLFQNEQIFDILYDTMFPPQMEERDSEHHQQTIFSNNSASSLQDIALPQLLKSIP